MNESNSIYSNIRNAVADLCHVQWSNWTDYFFSKGTLNEDGTVTIPVWAVERWKRQIKTPYKDLSESEQLSDLEEADKFISLIQQYNNSQS